MGDTLNCTRCLRDAPRLPAPPYPGALGEEIADKICVDCWAEWQHAEVMVINELRLNFMDPKSQRILADHMRDFLGLGGAAAQRPPE